MHSHTQTSSLSSLPPIVHIVKQKRSIDTPKTNVTKKKKLACSDLTITSLSEPVKEALCRFKEASECELDKLHKAGYEAVASISKLMDKMKSIADPSSISSSQYKQDDLELVMRLSGFDLSGATRALMLRDELGQLRLDGFNHAEAIDELTLRMKRLVGTKRPATPSPASPRKHTKRPRRSMNLGAPLDTNSLLVGRDFPHMPQNFSLDVDTPPSTSASILPLLRTPQLTSQLSSITRKRIYEELCEENWSLLKRQRLLDTINNTSPQSEDAAGESTNDGPDYLFSELLFTGHERESSSGVFPEQFFVPSLNYEDTNYDNLQSDIEGEDGVGPVLDGIDGEQVEQVWCINPLLSTKKVINTGLLEQPLNMR